MPNARAADAPASPTGTTAADQRVTRTGVIWAAVIAALVLLILLIVFIMQNQDLVLVSFLGFEGSVPLGMALFIASVAGAVLVAAAGGARILQLRAHAHRARANKGR
ncbi:lipopolysaccharide assembly protein LapA domain-containing protein [Pseudarthrobacter phenanthrenivorans]|uniref:lipopolysaccharide assembly protein LapA domain-containing protein n=1 Tax=Pseudarthrobacter phenanthrenivorans TaxID=361575 RepID=UPI0028772A02|nr:lipopolysaccharide assembly protein LapA domain-containing protein [Pseudarthrobacter phenanthrenivorans]